MEHVEAPVTGSVWKIECAVGDQVSEGDVLVILESMKMEIPVEADWTAASRSCCARRATRSATVSRWWRWSRDRMLIGVPAEIKDVCPGGGRRRARCRTAQRAAGD